jgi:beta-glucosidase
MNDERRFPDGFDWGTATAAHQIEGGNVNNDWWAFEHTPGSGCVSSSGDACDSWNRWQEDVDLVADLGLSSYRFSIEWSRIEPAEGEWSHAAIAHYRGICEALAERGVTPVVTLHHFTTPLWQVAKGGWAEPTTAEAFARFAGRVAKELGPGVGRFCTLNEPNGVAFTGYAFGMFPPGHTDLDELRRADETFIRGHRLAYDAVKEYVGNTPVGLTLILHDYQVAEGGEAKAAEAVAHEDQYLDAAAGDDFIGVQTYSRMRMGPDGWIGPEKDVPVVASMGYERWPDALEATIRRTWDRTGGRSRIYVTENGIAAEDDADRIAFVSEALGGVQRALADGIDVGGYTYWSLLDNFEWALGYGPRFGLVEVDRTTFERRPKPSARWFASVAAANALPR